MGRALLLRGDYDAAGVRGLARTTKHAGQARRLLALAAIYDGASRGEAARLAGTDRQIVRDWVVRFNAEGPEGVRDHYRGGRASCVTPSIREALKRRIEDGPIAAVPGVVRWRQADLGQWLYEEFGVSLSRSHLSTIIRGLDFRLLTGRARHQAQDPEAQNIFKKTFLPS